MNIIEVLEKSLPDICDTTDIVRTGIIEKESILRERIKKNLLPKYMKIGRLVRYRKKDILDWISSECPIERENFPKMTVAEVANYLKVSDNTIYRMLKEGLEFEKVKGITYISKDVLEKWIDTKIKTPSKKSENKQVVFRIGDANFLPNLCNKDILLNSGIISFEEFEDFKEKHPSIIGIGGNVLYYKESVLQYINQKRSI